MKPNLNTSLLVIAGNWDLHFNGLDPAHSVMARHASPYVLECFEDSLTEYVTDIGAKRFNEILESKEDQHWNDLTDEDMNPIRDRTLAIEGVTDLTVVLITHIWMEYRIMGNQSIWDEFLDLVAFFAPEPETETHDEPVAQGV